MARLGIVGGGILGMTLALRLRAQGHDVTLFDAAERAGGLAAAVRHGGYTWDRFYHVTLLSDAHLGALLGELGLEDRLRWGTTRTGVFSGGKLYSCSTSIEFLRFPPLSLLGKVRLAATILYASRIEDGTPLEAEPVGDWLIRWSGRKVYERFWLPLLRSKLGDRHSMASAAFIWAIIRRLYAARRSGLKTEKFGYVDGGYATVLPRFQELLDEMGVETLCGRRVEAVEATGAGPLVRCADGAEHVFDGAILTVPSPVVARVCPGLRDDERARLGRALYQGIICASVLLRRPLAEYYVTNITDDGYPFTGVIEMTTLVDRRVFGGNALVYLPRYAAQDDPFWDHDDDHVREEFLAALERMYPRFTRDDVLAFDVSRVRHVLAVSTLHYSRDVLPPRRTSLPDVFVVNSSQIAQGTLNVNETVGLANDAALELGAHFRDRRAVQEPSA